jgi:hypothetical protein
MSLLEDAKKIPHNHTSRSSERYKDIVYSPEDIELCVAFMRGEVTCTQIVKAKHMGSGGVNIGTYAYAYIVRCLQYAQTHGKINIIEF